MLSPKTGENAREADAEDEELDETTSSNKATTTPTTRMETAPLLPPSLAVQREVNSIMVVQTSKFLQFF